MISVSVGQLSRVSGTFLIFKEQILLMNCIEFSYIFDYTATISNPCNPLKLLMENGKI